MDVTRDSFVKIDSELAKSRDVGDSVVVMDLKNSVYFSIEGSIAQVWPSFLQGVVISDAAAELAQVFDAPVEEIEVDLIDLCVRLAERGVLEE